MSNNRNDSKKKSILDKSKFLVKIRNLHDTYFSDKFSY